MTEPLTESWLKELERECSYVWQYHTKRRLGMFIAAIPKLIAEIRRLRDVEKN